MENVRKVRKFKIGKFLLFLVLFIIILILALLGVYKYETSPVSSDTEAKTISVDEGDNYYTIAHKLKENNLIRSEMFYKVYLKISKPSKLINGNYDLNEAMSVAEIVKVLSDENNHKDNTLKITFREGLTVKQIANIVEEKTDIKAEDFISKIADTNYLKELQNDYWFLTDDIYNSQIYYPLEGYLFPDTYHFESNLDVDVIVRKMLDNTASKLESYKSEIESSSYSVHEIMTLASIIELEASTESDRAMVSGVFYNRLNNKWTLGSDVTTYYASKKALTDKLTKSDLTACNGYNTRCSTMVGLPVGPIDNPSITSIKAAIEPTSNDYYYFVADTDKKVYFTKNSTEHAKIIAKLKDEGKWAA